MENTTTSLTEKEYNLLARIAGGMDESGCGWLHEFADESHETAGVLGSLVKKGLVRSSVSRERGMPDCTWVDITPAGIEAAEAEAPDFTEIKAALEELGFTEAGLSNRGTCLDFTLGDTQVSVQAKRVGYNWEFSLIHSHVTDRFTEMPPEEAPIPEGIDAGAIQDIAELEMPHLFCRLVAADHATFSVAILEPDYDCSFWTIQIRVNGYTIMQEQVTARNWHKAAVGARAIFYSRA